MLTGMRFQRLALALASTLLAALPSLATAQAAHSQKATPWWKGAVLYEIYPRSFQDSTGNGIGDLNGIDKRLYYLQGLGVDAIWLAPMFPSPQVDFGYDISDYEAIDPQYGTMADFDKLLADAKTRHIRIILDMVLNHTSDKDKWFEESRSSRNNAKADWYVWKDAKGQTKDGKPIPPNNWQSVFGGPAWEWDPARKQFYYHRFYVQQPDLNWRNPAVEKAMFDVMRFWLDKGVAGFRLDAIPSLFEDPQMRNEPETGGTNAYDYPNISTKYTDNLPEVHGVIKRMRKMVDKYPGDRVLIGETYLPNVADLYKWYGGPAHNELQLPMDMLLGFGSGYSGAKKLDPGHFRTVLEDAETKLQGSEPLFVFSNHDNPRDWDRFGDGVHNLDIAKIIATVLLTPRATSLMYYGEEIGMRTHTPTRKEDVKDPIGQRGWPKEKGRDGERTPMQWTPGPQAGFSTNPHTWLPVAADHATVNVQTELKDPDSLLNWYLKLIKLKKTNPAFAVTGKMQMLMQTPASVVAYTRTGANGDTALVAMNMSGEPAALDVSQYLSGGKTLQTLANSAKLEVTVQGGKAQLTPFSVWIAELHPRGTR